MVLTCSAELGAYSLPSFRKSAAPLVPKALYALDWAEPADSPKQNSLATRPLYSHVAGPCAAPPAAAPFQDLCDLLWSLSLADALEEDGFASACRCAKQASHD